MLNPSYSLLPFQLLSPFLVCVSPTWCALCCYHIAAWWSCKLCLILPSLARDSMKLLLSFGTLHFTSLSFFILLLSSIHLFRWRSIQHLLCLSAYFYFGPCFSCFIFKIGKCSKPVFESDTKVVYHLMRFQWADIKHFHALLVGIYFHNVRVNSSHEHPPPGQTPEIWRTMSPGGGIWQLIVPAPGIWKQLFRNILSSFSTALRVKDFKHRHFGIRRAFIDHKRTIKTIKPFFLSLFSRSKLFRDQFCAVLLSWNSYVY